MSFVEKAIHSTTHCSPFEVVYEFIPLTLLREFLVCSIFNVNDLTPFDVGDNSPNSRTNHFEEREDEDGALYTFKYMYIL